MARMEMDYNMNKLENGRICIGELYSTTGWSGTHKGVRIANDGQGEGTAKMSLTMGFNAATANRNPNSDRRMVIFRNLSIYRGIFNINMDSSVIWGIPK